MEIFSKEAPRYWAKGLPVIPLRIMDKRPFFDDWSRYCLTMPTKVEQDEWLQIYIANNIGLPCGECSGIVMIDVDSDDPEVMKAINKVLPISPWSRVGRRGVAMAYRYNNTPSKKIVDAKGNMIVEIISTGGQVVLPPSIHPKTNKPYTANSDLVEVYDKLPLLPENVEDKLRLSIGQVIELRQKGGGLGKFKMTEFVPAGARDVQMNRHAGFLARAILFNGTSLKEALQDMQAWFDAKVQKVEGDTIDVRKGQAQIIQYLLKEVKTKGRILPTGWDADLSAEEKEVWGLKFDEAQEEWTYEQITEHVEKIYSEFGKNDPKRHECIQFILKKVAKSSTMDSLTVEKVLNLLRADSGISIATFRRQLKEIQAGPIEGLSHTEIADAAIKEIVEKFGKIANWNDTLWMWNGCHWEALDEQVIREIIQKEYGELQLAKRFSDHKQIVSVIKDLVPQKLKEDGSVEGVNFANGFLNRDLKLLAHSPEFGMTYTLPFCYRPETAGKCPMFQQYLFDSWKDDDDYLDKKKALQEAICVTLFGIATSFQRAIILYGQPNSGKSVILELIAAIVPDSARVALSPTEWDERFMPAEFSGKLLNLANELHETEKIDGKRFKEIISGEEITGEHKRGHPFKFRPTCAHWFAGNFLPKSNDTSGGFNRRWLFLTWNKKVPEDRIIRDLGKLIVQEEIEAVVAWAIEAFTDLKKRGNYTFPASHKERSLDMALQNSTIRQWLSERTVKKENASVRELDLYKDYWVFCNTSLSTRAVQPKTFGIELNQFVGEMELKPPKTVDGEPTYYGICLREKRK